MLRPMRMSRPRHLAAVVLLLALSGCGDRVAGSASGSATPTVDVAAGCPEQVPAHEGPWVPERPTTETEGRLVPDADPVSALVCRYEGRGFDGPLGEEDAAPLAGQVELTEGLEHLRHDLLLPEGLDGQRRACTLIGGQSRPYLMRLEYADGGLWVSSVHDPNSCQDSGNGDFTTNAYLGGRLEAAFTSRRWEPAAATPCVGAPGGRAGQERELVPAGWRSMTICSSRAGQGAPPEVKASRAQAEATVDALAEVRTRPGSNGCSGSGEVVHHLLFTYDEGPPVAVSFTPGCDPALRNGSLDGEPSAEQARRLEDAIRG